MSDQPTPETVKLQESMQGMAKAIITALQAEKQINITEFAIQLNVASMQIATLVDMLIASGAITREDWLAKLSERVDGFTEELKRPRIQLAAPRGRQ